LEPLSPDGDAPAVPPPLPAPRAPKFCGSCGSAWQADWTRCEPCAAQLAARLGTGTGGASLAGGPSAEPEGIIRIRSAVALYFTLLAVFVVCAFAQLAGAAEVPTDIAASVMTSFIVVVWCAASRPATIARLFKPARWVWYPIALLAACGTLAVAFGVIEALHRGVGMEKLSYAEPFQEAGYGLWLVFVMICVQPAVFEELAFRGVVLGSLRPTLSDAEAVIVSAMLFMTLHVAPSAFPHTFAMGLAAGIIRLRSGSLLPCMLLHFVHNSVVIYAEVQWGI
jgi:uncharacterized protein